MKTKGSELRRRARADLLGHFRVTIMAFLTTQIIISVLQWAFASALGDHLTTTQMVISYLADFLITLLALVFQVGIIYIHLNLARGNEIKLSMLFYAFKNRPDRYILASLISIAMMIIPVAPGAIAFTYFYYVDSSVMMAVIAIACLILSCILVIYVELSISFIYYILLDDEEITLGAAFKLCGQRMKGNRFRLFGYTLSFLGLEVLAILSLGIGLLWVTPYLNQSMAHFYLDLKGESVEKQTASADAFTQSTIY